MKILQRSTVRFLSWTLLLSLSVFFAMAGTQTETETQLAAKIDAVMGEIYKASEPGAAIIVQKEGKTIFRKGYGMANLELGVPIEPDMVFRLGSITKQFTATAILMLASQGKLSLQDDITTFLPAFPTRGKKVTIEHLLTHTSGIPSYTEMPEWLKLWRQDMTPDEIMSMSKNKPFEFEPGQRWAYNNTGYIMLGAIIERISGKRYDLFLQEQVFTPLGMKHTYYDRTEQVIPRRVSGYQKGNDGIANAPFLSMTQPYAAGALMSSLDDMAKWNDAIFSGKLLKKEWMDKAFTPYRTADGESTGYGYGWFVASLRGHRTIEHGGGVHGFSTYEIALPDDGIYIAILTNSTIDGRAPQPRAERVAELVLGMPPVDRKPFRLASEDLNTLVGVYENRSNEARYITREGDTLFSQRAGGSKYSIIPVSSDECVFADTPTSIRFIKDAQGKIQGLRLEGRIGPAEIYQRTKKPLPTAKREIILQPAVLARFVGEYELFPGFTLVMTLTDGHLMSQATDQEKVELFPESETKFFLKVVDVQIVFDLDAAGKTTGLTLFQGGEKISGKKIK